MGVPGMILAPVLLNYIKLEASTVKAEPRSGGWRRSGNARAGSGARLGHAGCERPKLSEGRVQRRLHAAEACRGPPAALGASPGCNATLRHYPTQKSAGFIRIGLVMVSLW